MLKVGRPFSSLNIRVCCVGLSFTRVTECLCQMVRRRCHGEGESEFFLGVRAFILSERMGMFLK